MILQSITHSAHCRILNKVYIFLLTLCCTMYHVFLIIIMLYLALYWSTETVQPVHFSFYPFWGAKNSSFLYFNFVGLFSLFNFFFINDFFFHFMSYLHTYLLHSIAIRSCVTSIQPPYYIVIYFLFFHWTRVYVLTYINMLFLSPLCNVYYFHSTIFRQLPCWGIFVFIWIPSYSCMFTTSSVSSGCWSNSLSIYDTL